MFLSTVCVFWFPFSLRTCDHGPTFHWVGQACRLQGLRVSGRSSLQCLLWMARVVLSSDGWTQLTERICIPVFPHGLLQFCHSPVTQLEKHRGRERNRSSGAFKMSNCWSKQWQKRKSKGRLCVENAVGFVRFGKFCFYSWCHKCNAYIGGGQGFWLQSLVSPLGFMLDLLQKLLWTILLSTFLLQPYRRYCFPTARGDGEFNKCRSRETGMQ